MNYLITLAVFPAYLVASFFIKHDPGPPEPKKEIRRAVWFGVLSVIVAVGLSLLFSQLTSGSAEADVAKIASNSSIPYVFFIFVFATIEELAKFVPIAIYLRYKPFFNENTDGIIYFATVGLTFGAVENFLYGLGAGGFGVGLIISRLIIALFFHGALTSIAGYFYAKAHIQKTSLVSPVLALFAVSVAHTVYNYFAFGAQEQITYILGAAIIAIATNGLMFWLYFVASDRDIKLGLAGPSAISDTAQNSNLDNQA